ncbi:MAG: PepSY domain-containing protein, partial [Moritella sp.]|nr:PepSY domain-containing protein [Moritella sp.]
EIQIDNISGKILQVEYRRSDLIESLHDGSFFHEYAKLWLFLPAAVILLMLWITGIYMFLMPYILRRQNRKKVALRDADQGLSSLIN